MAQSILNKQTRRTDMYFVDPFEITVNEELRGRRSPPTEQQVIEMAESLLDHGQRQPVEVRKMPDKTIQLVLGFTRTAAARLIRQGFEGSDGGRKQDEQFVLKVVAAEVNDRDAFIHNVIENAHRNETSPVDDAHNQNRMRDRYGMTDAEIARLYRCDPSKVSKLRKLVAAPDEIQALVHAGGMSLSAALDTLELPDEQRSEVIASATQENGKVSGTAVRQQVRERILADQEGEANSDGNGKPKSAKSGKGAKGGETEPDKSSPARTAAKSRTRSEMMAFFRAQAENGEVDAATRKFFATVVLWADGKRADKTMEKAVADLREGCE